MTEDSQSQVTNEDLDRNDKEQHYVGCATGQVASHWLLNREAWVQSQASPCGICDEQSGNGAHFTPRTSVFRSEYHSINAPYSLMLLTPHNLKNWQCHEIAHLKKQDELVEYMKFCPAKGSPVGS
jgi:hypothetical protein